MSDTVSAAEMVQLLRTKVAELREVTAQLKAETVRQHEEREDADADRGKYR